MYFYIGEDLGILNNPDSLELPLSIPVSGAPALRLHAACEAAARLLGALARWVLSINAVTSLPYVFKILFFKLVSQQLTKLILEPTLIITKFINLKLKSYKEKSVSFLFSNEKSLTTETIIISFTYWKLGYNICSYIYNILYIS